MTLYVGLMSGTSADGIDAVVTNAGVSGDTSAGGLARLDWSLADHPDAVILELGGNDMLRGIAPAETEKNLRAILARLNRDAAPAQNGPRGATRPTGVPPPR